MGILAALEAGTCGFDPHPYDQFYVEVCERLKQPGCNPGPKGAQVRILPSSPKLCRSSSVVERRSETPKVASSILVSGTKICSVSVAVQRIWLTSRGSKVQILHAAPNYGESTSQGAGAVLKTECTARYEFRILGSPPNLMVNKPIRNRRSLLTKWHLRVCCSSQLFTSIYRDVVQRLIRRSLKPFTPVRVWASLPISHNSSEGARPSGVETQVLRICPGDGTGIRNGLRNRFLWVRLPPGAPSLVCAVVVDGYIPGFHPGVQGSNP